MCSISGFFDNVTSESAQEKLSARERLDVVERMNRALEHRGPDDEGVVSIDIKSGQGFLCLGNTRLAVIDVSPAGHQPMHDPDTGNWITYNGETYNFRELRREIGNEFGPWLSNTDTEVVLRAYRKWGRDAFARLRGMFAVAIWDRQEEALVLARDRFGIKPLYYSFVDSVRNATPVPDGDTSFTAERFVFASEVRALLASGLVPRKLSSAALGSYLEFGSVQSPLSILENVWSLMPGKCLTVKQRTTSTFSTSLTSLSDSAAAGNSTYREVTTREQAKVELRGVLEDSVRQHLVSDVPMGVFLSGGMDSSALVALMSRVEAGRPKTFSVVFNEEKFNESEHSRLVANKFQTDHQEIHLSEESLLDQLPDAIAALDQPTMDGINTYVVSKAVKEAGVTVALSGLGGDELFGGYPSFARALRIKKSSVFARKALRLVSGVGSISASGSVQQKKFWQLIGSDGSPEEVYRITRQLFAPDVVRDLLADPSLENNHSLASSSVNEVDTVNAMSRLEFEGYMANTLLRDTDSMSMAHSLEVRVPFVDVGVVDFVRRLPGSWKLNGNTAPVPKPLLADVLTDLLPADFLGRRKMGFTLPFEKWMTTNLRAEISGVFEDKSLCGAAGIKQANTERVWQRFLRQPKAITWSRPWSLYVLAKWCHVNRVTS